MINQINKYLEATDHLRNNIGVFIEAFVKYYGEDRRKEIEEAISKVLPIAYRSPVATVRFIDTISKEKTKELYHKMIDGIETNFTEKEYVFQKRLSNGSIVKDQDSVYHVVIEPQDTNNLTFGKYVYDIELINGSTVKQTTTGKLLLNYESTYAINEVSAL